MKKCACGCGKDLLNEKSTYLRGHHSKFKKDSNVKKIKVKYNKPVKMEFEDVALVNDNFGNITNNTIITPTNNTYTKLEVKPMEFNYSFDLYNNNKHMFQFNFMRDVVWLLTRILWKLENK